MSIKTPTTPWVVKIKDPQRKAEWEPVFGCDRAPVKFNHPHEAVLPIGKRMVYELDLGRLTDKQFCALVAHIAKKFNLDPDEVRRDIHEIGVPILAEGVTIENHKPQRFYT